jgi:hypothetical protein
MEINENTQGQRLEIRGTQDRNQNVSIEEKQRGGIRSVSKSSRNNDVRSSGSNWGWGNPFGTFGSEIINRLISQAEVKLKESKECIDWYQRQSEELEQELEELKELQQLHLTALDEAEQEQLQTEEE